MDKKTILLLGIDGDFTIQYVMDWLYSKGVQIKKITGRKINIIHTINSTPKHIISSEIIRNKNNINNDTIDKIWLHRISLPSFSMIKGSGLNKVSDFINKFHTQEYLSYLNYFFSAYSKEKFSVPFNQISVNKMQILTVAKEVGLIIPSTKIITSKEELIQLKKKYRNIIVKPISECLSFNDGNYSYAIFTTKIKEKHIKKQNDMFFPVLIQEYIPKLYEIRVFYLEEKCYSMAIFSQQNKSTSVDWRNKNNFFSNKTVPYILPPELTSKIKKLMNRLDLKTGSIDFIYSKYNEYVFLEINPVGQFGMVSNLCNYSLYKKFAEYLIK